MIPYNIKSTDPLNHIPDPPVDLQGEANTLYYRICQWLIDREALSEFNLCYIGRLAAQIVLHRENAEQWDDHEREQSLEFIQKHCEILNFATKDIKEFNIPT
ncbi:MAG: hypothetical protein LC641_01890 [Spirochaeta sp.]|nr:hypothetical protein [Spirochaeta sp.]